jgi:glutamyl-tRNA reductase
VNLLLVGCNYKTAPIALREQLALDGPKLAAALHELEARYAVEAAILSTCNRVELYLARADDTPVAHAPGSGGPDGELIAEFLAQFHGLPAAVVRPCLYVQHGIDAVRQVFRVTCSLDSLVIGEGQIVGQVKHAYEVAHAEGTAGPVLHILFQQALAVAKRVRTQTGISRGHVSVSSVAVDYVRQVFERFDDKTMLVIGAGKMGELTLRHLKALAPRRILVANRSPEKAALVAAGCGGESIAWDTLDDALVQADIVLSTTGAPEPIVTRRRFDEVLGRRSGTSGGNGPIVILDIAVPRDFDPRIHDGERACLFNIDDLQRIREQTLHERQKSVAPAEAIVEREVQRFLADWSRRRNGPIIARLTQEFEARRRAIVAQLLAKLNGRLSAEDRVYVEGAFKLLQNQFLHGPISVLAEETQGDARRHTLLEALRKLFRIEE